MKKICIFCHKEFEKDFRTSRFHFRTMTKLCSIKCKALYQKSHGIKPPSRKGKMPWCYGKHNPYFAGANNPKWKGGVSKLHKTARNLAMETIEYKLWRRSVFIRDDFTCKRCGERGGRLEADHIKPWSLFPELRYAIDNGRTLCQSCHHKVDTAKLNQYNQKEVYRQFLVN
jgi:hypothetical protein